MKKGVKQTIYLLLISIILFSAAMAIPYLYNSQWREVVQGGAVGVFIAAMLSLFKIWVEYKKQAK